MRDRTELFGELTKVEEQPDGTLKVYGFASSGARDDAGEIITPVAMKAALPGYLMYPAIREMHKPDAAGTALEIGVDADTGKTTIVAHVVDPVAITKVRNKVYRGFSVGGKVLKRDRDDPTIITAIKLIEVSLVDRPCNPEASINMWKATDVDLQTEELIMSVRQPTNEEVKAEAEAMAKAAGKPGRHNDFIVKARETLLANFAAEDAVAEMTPALTEEISKQRPDLSDELVGKAVELALTVDSGKLTVEDTVKKALEALPEATLGDSRSDIVEKPAAEVDKVLSPVDALAAALAKAEAVFNPKAEAEPASQITEGLDEVGKALALMQTRHADQLAKGMYQVSRLAELIERVVSLQAMSAWEEREEGDTASTVPAMLAASVKQLGDTLKAMANEEIGEMMVALQEANPDIEFVFPEEDVEMAARVIDMVKVDETLMAKVGARHSKADKARAQGIHDHSVSLGAKCDAENCGKSASAEDLEKVSAEAQTYKTALLETVPRIEALTKLLEDQSARIAHLESTPMPPKTAVASIAVEKTVDAQGPTVEKTEPDAEDIKKWWDSLTPEQRAHETMKASLARPIAIQR